MEVNKAVLFSVLVCGVAVGSYFLLCPYMGMETVSWVCIIGAAWLESRGQLRDGSYVPASGDLIFFDWGKDGIIDHVGIVESVTDDRINTIEGNSRNCRAKRNYGIGIVEFMGMSASILK